MSTQIQAEHFTNALYTLLDETFDDVHGYFLDKGTSMFETLATISAEEASIPVGGKCATIAAQVIGRVHDGGDGAADVPFTRPFGRIADELLKAVIALA